ncbi:MAG TPA: ATP-binding protein [Candidatus Polarisedimenticolia bacterium]|nr:ATP-binding protein [Candidatus Polarisedimenticolia bacterium]
MRKTLAVAVSALLLAWGVAAFYAQVTRITPQTGVEWIDSSHGVVADAVIPRQPAWKGGLRPGDRVHAINGVAVASALAADDATWSVPAGQALTYRVERDGEEIELRVQPIWAGGGSSPVYYYLSIVALTFLGVGVVVWMRATRARAAIPFALLCQAMFLFLVLDRNGQGGLLDWSAYWGDLTGSLLAPALFVHINWALTDEESGSGRRRLRRALFYLPPLLLLLYNLYLIPFKGVYRFSDPEAAIRLKNRLEQLYIAVFVIAGIVKAVRSYLSAERLSTRWQLKWMAWGSLVGFLPAALFYLLPLSLNIRIGTSSELSVLTIAVIPLAFAAAIVRYRLLDLDVFLKRGIVATGLLLSAAATYAACYVIMDRAAGEITPRGLNLALILATFLMAIFYPRLHRRLKSAVDQFFYRERYDYRRTLTEFGEALNRELSLPALRRKFTGRVERTFALERVEVFVRDREGRDLCADPPGGALDPDDPIVGRLRAVDYFSLRDHSGVGETPTGAFLLDTLGLEYLLPMTVEGQIVAVLGVGRTHGGEPLNTEDLDLLVSLCRHAAVAFQGARLYSAVEEKVQEVEALKEFNESILESSRVGILVADPQGRVVGVNRAFELLYGAPRADVLGLSLSQVMPAGVFTLATEGAWRDPAEPLPDDGIRVYRSSLRTRDDRRLLVNLTQSALRGPDGRPRGRVITIDDVTEQVQREEEVQRREHLASVGLLASGIAHEVNTPLTGISSYTQMLLQERRPDDPEYSILKKIEQQAFRAAGIASSLLNFSRQREGDYQPIEVADMVEETLELFEPHLRGRRILLARRVETPLPHVSGNRGRLQQVLMNLLLNAVDAMPQGGTVTVSARASAGRLRLEVSDTGVGIPAEHLEKIYDPFFTTKARGQGTGLGLSVSYGIVKEHAGTLAAESSPGEGSRFIVSLPLADGEARRASA